MANFNLHTHTHFCDGKEAPEEYVLKALDLGFHTLGFSGHAPVPFKNHFAIKDNELNNYFKAVGDLKEKFASEIEILLALEIDYIPGITKSFIDFTKLGNLDYTIGGIHLIKNKDKEGLWFIDGPLQETYDDGLMKLFNGHARKGVEAYYNQMMEMITTQQPDIIAHFDKIKMHNKDRYFSEEEGWYKELAWKNLKYIAKETDCIIEINTRGLYKKRAATTFPGPALLEQILHLNIPVTLSSDAHHPDELDGYYLETMGLLKDIGFKELNYFSKGSKKKQLL